MPGKRLHVPCTIVRSTQFFEFLGAIAGSAAGADGTVRLPHAKMQPIAANDVASALAEVAISKPLNGMMEIGGPDAVPMDEIVSRYLTKTKDARRVVADAGARYFGEQINDRSLITGDRAHLGPTNFEKWMAAQAPAA